VTATPLPPHVVHQRLHDTACAYLAVFDTHEDMNQVPAWMLNVYIEVDGGRDALGMDVAQYGTALQQHVDRLRTTGAYTRCRATVEATASAEQERADQQLAAALLGPRRR
jgi:hypothetical protein